VTDFASDTRLRQAFEALADVPGPEVSDELRDRIWLAVSGELSPDERRDLIDRTASNAACAQAWRVAHALWEASQAGSRWTHRRGVRWPSPWLVSAAAALVAITVGGMSLIDWVPADQFRASPGLVVSSLIQAETPLPRDAFQLRWTPGPEGSRYQVRVTTEDLQVLVTAADLTVAEFIVGPATLAPLADGRTVLWQVDVLLPEGGRITSPTFIARVQ
jgi:hypothetical protein